jgi:subfamily B ATP-binding cassette protein MsbA
MHIISEGMGAVAAGTMILFSIYFLRQNTFSLITQILPFIYILIRMLPVVKDINRSRGQIAGNLPFLSIVEEFLRLNNKPFLTDGDRKFPGLQKDITFHKVNFSYLSHDRLVLEDIDFKIPKGKKTAIVGESGAGKSTLVGLLLRFYDPTAGKITIDGHPLTDYQVRTYREQISIVSQDTFIFNDSVMNNIRFGVTHDVDDEMIFAAARQAGAHNFIQEMADGYDTMLGDRGVRLSGGQRQRLAIARAILKNPEILILDEATSSLDNQTEKHVHAAIINLSQNRTVIMIAHRLSSIQGADQIIVMKQGRVAEMGDAATLMAQQGEYHRLATMDH